MALDLGQTMHQLLTSLDDVALASRARSQRIDDAMDRAFTVSSDEAVIMPY